MKCCSDVTFWANTGQKADVMIVCIVKYMMKSLFFKAFHHIFNISLHLFPDYLNASVSAARSVQSVVVSCMHQCVAVEVFISASN